MDQEANLQTDSQMTLISKEIHPNIVRIQILKNQLQSLVKSVDKVTWVHKTTNYVSN